MTKKLFMALASTLAFHNAYAAPADRFTDTQLELLAVFCQNNSSIFDKPAWLTVVKTVGRWAR